MKISISNLGSVSCGEINLNKKLTVFCGPNNTGKTYMSYILYAMMIQSQNILDIDEFDISTLMKEGEQTISIKTENIIQYSRDKENYIKNNLGSIFGISPDQAHSLFEDMKISIVDIEEDVIKSLKFNYDFEWTNGLIVAISKEASSMNVLLKTKTKATLSGLDIFLLSHQITLFILSYISTYPFFNACIFPVERNSIYTFNKELSIQRNELIEQMQALKDNQRADVESVDRLLGRSTRYPLAIRDCLRVANDLNNIQKNKSQYYDFAQQMENELLSGQISVTKEGEVQFAPKKPKRNQKLPIHLSASIIKTLSSLTFYLKHLAKKGDLIIIDEPEMNLHPDAQIILTRLFVKMVHNGLNILISTHSDYIIRELNNLITLHSVRNKKPEALIDLKNYEKVEDLAIEDIDVYLFKPVRRDSLKSKITQVPIAENGFSIETIDNVICTLNDNTDLLNSILQEDD